MRTGLILLVVLSLFKAEAKDPYWRQVARGYERPVALTQLPSGSFLVLEQEGKIFETDFSSEKGVEIHDWSKRVSRRGNEQGLLGVALDPGFQSNGRLYLNLTNRKDATELWRLTVDPRNPGQLRKEAELILSIDQPWRNHNGGWIGFGPDRLLYVATGDGGSANDPKNYAQDLNSLLGKILRIDVSGAAGYRIPKDNPTFSEAARPEIYAYGLRNPWRCDWHKGTFYIADVGQNAWEEINIVSKKKLRAANFGWRLREGAIATPKKKIGGERPGANIEPIYVYPHDTSKETGGLSVTGGFLYHGSVASLRGRYFFADYVSTKIWSFIPRGGKATGFRHHHKEIFPDRGGIQSIASFGEDRKGELYLLCFNGSIYQLDQK